MQIVKVMGGLGNQMFAYAFALGLRRLGREVYLDTSWHERIRAHNGWELGRIFSLDIPLCRPEDLARLADLSDSLGAKLRRKLLGTRKGHFVEAGPGYDPRYLDLGGDAYLDGYWQSPRYHEGIGAEIEASLRFPAGLEDGALACLGSSTGRSVIGVHVRRGDYLESEALGGVCGEAYYRRAIEGLSKDAVDPLVLFFSDDLDWCREKLGVLCDAVYVDWNRGADSWRDMRLMTRCDRLAISNSSFGWWAARLGSATRVIAPDRWYGGSHADNKEIALPSWIRMASGGEG